MMKGMTIFICIVAFCTIAFVGCGVSSRKPTEFKKFDISREFIEFFDKSCKRNARWTKNPIEVAMKLMYFGSQDPLDYNTDISLVRSGEKAWVHIHEKNCPDDSVYETYNVIELLKTEKGHWLPVKYEGCWKGRGLSGWSTELAK